MKHPRSADSPNQRGLTDVLFRDRHVHPAQTLAIDRDEKPDQVSRRERR